MCGNSSARHVQLSISTCSFIFIRRSPSLHSFESPFWRSVSPLPISLSSPPISSLYSFHLTTPMAHPHSISSLTPYNLDPAFPLLQLSVSIKRRKNVILLCFYNLVLLLSSNIIHLWRGFLKTIHMGLQIFWYPFTQC